jgi:hypothetical protein
VKLSLSYPMREFLTLRRDPRARQPTSTSQSFIFVAVMSLQGLNYLLKASSKDTVEKILNLVYISRYEASSVSQIPSSTIIPSLFLILQIVTPTITALLTLDDETQAEEVYFSHHPLSLLFLLLLAPHYPHTVISIIITLY